MLVLLTVSPTTAAEAYGWNELTKTPADNPAPPPWRHGAFKVFIHAHWKLFTLVKSQ